MTTEQRSTTGQDVGRDAGQNVDQHVDQQVGQHVGHDGQQLALLPPADAVPVQLRLSTRTRRLGLAGVAGARAILAEQAQRRRDREAQSARLPRRAA
jgi:hypothetical protein